MMDHRPGWFVIVAGGLLACVASGCGNRLVMIERPKGEIELRQPKTGALPAITVDPLTASSSKNSVDVTVRHAAVAELDQFFSKKEVFGNLAGKNPYPPDTVVFYVRVSNHSGKKLKVNPGDFVLIDNLNIQYAELSADDISALYEGKGSVWGFARTTGDLAPGPYGVPLKVAGAMGGGGVRKMHYLIKQVRLAGGFIHPGIAYDGYVAFPRPHPNAVSMRLVIGNLKTDFDPADVPATSLDFDFSFHIQYPKS